MKAIRYLSQGVLYAAFVAFVGYFSERPVYHQIEPGEALIRLTVSHAAQPESLCRRRTPEELAKLPANMRAPLDCPRRRASVTLELELDGVRTVHAVAAPSGLSGDGRSSVYRRIVVPAGPHRVRARLADNAQGRFDYATDRVIELAAGRALTIDFNAAAGGFVFIQ